MAGGNSEEPKRLGQLRSLRGTLTDNWKNNSRPDQGLSKTRWRLFAKIPDIREGPLQGRFLGVDGSKMVDRICRRLCLASFEAPHSNLDCVGERLFHQLNGCWPIAATCL